MLATIYLKIPPRRNWRLSSHAPANAAAEWPDGNDQVPGFLPMTIAWMIVMKGCRRLKYFLIGCSTSQLVMVKGTAAFHSMSRNARRLHRTVITIRTYQAAPPLKASVMP